MDQQFHSKLILHNVAKLTIEEADECEGATWRALRIENQFGRVEIVMFPQDREKGIEIVMEKKEVEVVK